MGILDRKKDEPERRYSDWPTEVMIEAAAQYVRDRLGPLVLNLPPHDDRPACPKCGNLAVTIDYHSQGGHERCSDGRFNTMRLGFGWMTTPKAEDLGRERVIAERKIEHMDRKCQNCGYGWVTDIAHLPYHRKDEA
jgi:ribosomal protein S27AE